MANKISVKVTLDQDAVDTVDQIMTTFEDALELLGHNDEDLLDNFYTMRFDIDEEDAVSATVTATRKKA